MLTVYVPSDDLARKISRGQINRIVKSRPFHAYVHKPILIAGRRFVWGKIILGEPGKFKRSDVARLNVGFDVKKAYPGARYLYVFKTAVIEPMDPTPYSGRSGDQFFDAKLDNPPKSITSSILEIQDIDNYDPAQQTRQQRLDDWRILVAQYANHLAGKSSPWTKSQIERTALALVPYMSKHDHVIFHPDTMTSAGKALFNFVLRSFPDLPHTLSAEELAIPPYKSQRPQTLHKNLHLSWAYGNRSDAIRSYHSTLIRLTDDPCPDDELSEERGASYPPLVVTPDAISLVGSVVYWIQGRVDTVHDIDVLSRYEAPFFTVAKEVADRINTAFSAHESPDSNPKDESIDGPLNPHMFYAPRGPNWDYIPLGDLVAAQDPPQSSVEHAPLKELEGLSTICLSENFVSRVDGNIIVYGPQDEGFRLKLNRLLGLKSIEFREPSTEGAPIYGLYFVPHKSLCIVRVDDHITEAQSSRHYSPGTPFTPLKVAGGYHVGEFYTIQDALDLAYSDDEIKSGVVVQPKADGIRLVMHKRGNRVWIFTEDRKRDRAPYLKSIAQDLRSSTIDSFIIDTETIEYNGRDPVPREKMVELVVAKHDATHSTISWVHDCVYFNGKDISALPYTERLKYARRVVDSINSARFAIMPTRTAHSKQELRKAMEWARDYHRAASEGAMLKLASSPYAGERSKAWSKVKMALELRVRVIGYAKKPNPWSDKPKHELTGHEAISAYKRLTASSRTYLIRGAVLKSGKLVPIEAERKLSPGDVSLRWTGSRWTGLEDPHIWTMDPAFPHRKAGELAYASTYAKAFDHPPKIGALATVRPMGVDVFTTPDGKEHASWMFPVLHELDPDKTKPDTWDDILRLARSTSARRESRSSSVDQDLKEGVRVPLTRDESREKIKKELGKDWYVVKQPPNVTSPFVVQYHVRGIIHKDDLKKCVSELRSADSQEALTRVWKRWGLITFKMPVRDAFDTLRKVDDNKTTDMKAVERAVDRVISTAPPGALPPINQIYAYGNVHTDFRIRHPTDDFLIGWTLDTPKIAFQPLTGGKILFPLRGYMLENQDGDKMLAQQKLSQPCLHPDTLVLTTTHIKPASLIRLGDTLIDAHGQPTPVISVSRVPAGEWVRIVLPGMTDLVVTPDHPFLTSDGLWTQARDLTSHEIVMPRPLPFTQDDFSGGRVVVGSFDGAGSLANVLLRAGILPAVFYNPGKAMFSFDWSFSPGFSRGDNAFVIPVTRVVRFASNTDAINIVTESHTYCVMWGATHNTVWLSIVSPKRTHYWRYPTDIGATSHAGAVFIYAASGRAVFGTQKSEHYHEYFLRFDRFGPVRHKPASQINGRWDFRKVQGKWLGMRPWSTQDPYITTHDYDTEAAKEKAAHRQWEWNTDTLKALKKLF